MKFIPTPSHPSWRGFNKQYKAVAEDYLKGLTVQQIAQNRGLPLRMVKLIVSKAALRQTVEAQRKEFVAEVMQEKIPILKEIVGLNLLTLRDWMESLHANEAKKNALTTQDAKFLSSIAKEMNEILKLDLGQPTQSLEVVHKVEKDVTVILEELKEIDPFVEYPTLPDAKPRPQET